MTEAQKVDDESSSIAALVQALAGPLAASLNLELVEVVIVGQGSRRVVRLVVDSPEGAGVDAMAALSRAVSEPLDEDESLIPGGYTLEVTSPGVDRPLTEARHFARTVGRLVEIEYTATTNSGAQEVRTSTGKLAEADDAGVVVNVKGRMVSIAFNDVRSAKAVLPW